MPNDEALRLTDVRISLHPGQSSESAFMEVSEITHGTGCVNATMYHTERYLRSGMKLEEAK